jgi:hypothetical protein
MKSTKHLQIQIASIASQGKPNKILSAPAYYLQIIKDVYVPFSICL